MMQQTPDAGISSVPLVSVAITACNSEHALAQAIDSVLAQKTQFSFEIVVGDDCSKDATLTVANSYADRYPGIVRVLVQPVNVGIQRNYYQTFEACRGKYIAWLDADDYWTDPEKLAIQTQVLEADPTVMVCGHLARFVTTNREMVKERHPSTPTGRFGLEEIIRCNFLPSLSVVFRNGIHHELPQWYFDLAPITDWPIWVIAAKAGDIVLLDRVMADYTLTPDSAFMGKGLLYGNRLDARFYDHVVTLLSGKYVRIANAEKGLRYESVAYLLRKEKDFIGSRKAAVKAFLAPAVFDNVGSKSKTLLASIVREIQWRISRRAKSQAQS
jgi:glycosyltransferase involved in cell wall biosynthesis